MERALNLRSTDSHHQSFVAFVNRTQRRIGIYWVDYEGKFVHYMNLNPGNRTIINTFSTHPWLFMDTTTGERMHVENNEVFWPTPSNRELQRRKQIDIQFPIRTLRQNVMWTLVKETIRTYKDIERWEIPRILKVELQRMFEEYEKFKPNASVRAE